MWKSRSAYGSPLLRIPLNPRAIGSLRSLLGRLKLNGLEWDEPEWWRTTVAALDSRYPKGDQTAKSGERGEGGAT